MTERLFHLVPLDAWAAFRAGGRAPWTPPGFAAEGFVHLSYARQLRGTLEAHFAAVDAVALHEVELAEHDPALRVETSRGGDGFPHLYRPLEPGELARSWTCRRRDGVLEPPELGARAADDRPAGQSPWAADSAP